MKNINDQNNNSNNTKFGLNAIKIFLIFMTILALPCFLYGEPMKISAIDKIIIIGPFALCLLVGVSLYVFFSKQIIDITITDKKVSLRKASGKEVYVDCDLISIMETRNRYVFVLNDGKKFSAYKYMPPRPYEHKCYISSKVEILMKNKGMLH